jgi:tetratricopeptide (TPR) repeat protein
LKKRTLHILLYSTLLVGLLGCATNKNNWRTRGFHRLNTRYNGYYYAREALKDGLQKIDKGNIDDYSNILPLFVYPSKETQKMASGDMEKVIKKCTSAIERHMITDKKNVEIARANYWIEDCFLTIGEARFYKLEYFAATDAFEYVTKKYVKWPIHYDGFLWLIRTYNETSIFSKSEELLTLLKDDKKFPKNKNAELYSLAADYNIRREMYQAAIQNLTKAIVLLEPIGPLKDIAMLKNSPIGRNKNQRARYMYVLAQLYERMGDNKKASELFAQVVKLRPRYDMEFNARLNHARLYDFSDGKGEQIKEELLKMAKDFKNEDYRDQIYYTLAIIELQENQEAKGIDYLKKSVRVSTKNPSQKTHSYLKLADLYYDKPDYRLAQAYYDSVVPLIKKDYPDYDLIVAKDKNLNDLIKNLKVITREDSLQKVAAMDTTTRNLFIDKLIADAKEADRKKEQDRLNAAAHNTGTVLVPANGVTPNSTANQNNEAGSWYFYNSAAISFGIADFKKKWGDRKPEDDWRRLTKETNGFADQGAATADVQDTTKAGSAASKDVKKKGGPGSSSRDAYIKGLPLTKDAVDKSNLRLVDAYYNAGMLYKEALMNNPKAAATFEEMLSRFPENKYIPNSYYFLYRIYLSMQDQDKADQNRDIILNKYPGSALAEMLKHPENSRLSHAREDSIKGFYTATYALFLSGNYSDVVQRCYRADSLYGGSKLSPKFDYMKALSLGHTSDLKTYENALTAITVKYPKDEVRNQAMGMLEAIKRVSSSAAANGKADSVAALKKEKYFYREDVPHYAIIVLKGKGLDATAVKTNLSNFNQQYFPSKNLTISGFPITEEYQIIQVKDFTDKKDAMTYYEFVKGDKDVFKDIPLTSTEVYLISTENFPTFFHEKNTDDYKLFFNENYFKKSP